MITAFGRFQYKLIINFTNCELQEWRQKYEHFAIYMGCIFISDTLAFITWYAPETKEQEKALLDAMSAYAKHGFSTQTYLENNAQLWDRKLKKKNRNGK